MPAANGCPVRFVAIDFETANAHRSSVCAIGAVSVVNGRITDQQAWLVRPSPFFFDPWNVHIHGITEKTVQNAPEFRQCWRELLSRIDGNMVVAHNASFDFSVLRATLDGCSLPYPQVSYMCSLLIARRVWPEFASYRLPVLATAFGIPLNHHDAEQDARACAEIILRARADLNADSITDLASRCEISPGKLFSGGYVPCTAERLSETSVFDRRTMIVASETLGGKRFVFTGTLTHYSRREAQRIVKAAGGRVSGSVSKKTDYVVAGEEAGSKLDKARELGVRVIGESEMLQLVGKV